MRSEVVLELDSGSLATLRSGHVVSSDGPHRLVDWGGGSTSRVRLGRDGSTTRLAVVSGGLRHLSRVARAEVERLVITNPETVFAMALRDAVKPAATRYLVSEVEQALTSVDAGALWKKFRPTFEARRDVATKGDGPQRRYTWTGDSDPTIDGFAPAPLAGADKAIVDDFSSQPVDDARMSQVPDFDHEEPVESAATGATQAAGPAVDGPSPALNARDVLADGLGALLKRDMQAVDNAKMRQAAHRVGAATSVVVSALLGEEPSARTRELAAAVQAPLASSRELAQLDDPSLTALASRLVQNELILLALAGRAHKQADEVDLVSLVGSESAHAMLRQGVAALRAAPPSEASTLHDAYKVICRRVLSHDSAGALTPAQLLELTAPVRLSSRAKEAEWFAGLVLRSLRRSDSLSEGFGPRERQDAARRVTAAPLARSSNRAKLITQLWMLDRPEATDLKWWQNATFDSLADVAAGPLGAVLESDVLATSLVRTATEQALAAAQTRRQLFHVLSAPRPMLASVKAALIADVVRRVMSSDEVARLWLADLSRAELLEASERQIAVLRGQLLTADDQLDLARREAEHARERMLRLEMRLTQAGDETHKVRESQTRQASLNSLRAMAEVSAYVSTALEEGRPASRISQRVQALLARDGLTPIGSYGEMVAYNPAEHELLGEDQSVETPVIVTGIGYKLTEPDGEEQILTKATVIPRS